MQILVVGTVTVDPARRQAVLDAVRPLVQRTREQEPGCLAYAFTADTVLDDLLQVVEHWQDEESLAAHFQHPNFLETKAVLAGRGSAQSAIRKYRVDRSGPVRDQRGYRADFSPSD